MIEASERAMDEGHQVAGRILAAYVDAAKPPSVGALMIGLAEALAVTIAGATASRREYLQTVKQVDRFLRDAGPDLLAAQDEAS